MFSFGEREKRERSCGCEKKEEAGWSVVHHTEVYV
jgi:hypothetical protein